MEKISKDIFKKVSNFGRKIDTVERYYCQYDTPGNAIHSDWAGHYLIYKKFLSVADKVSCLDLCCGSGAGTKFIANSLDTKVIGVDYSSEAIQYAQKTNSDSRIQYEKFDLNKNSDLSNLEKIIINNKIKQVFFIEGIEHLKDPFLVVGILLKSGVKRIFISTPFEKEDTIPSAFHIHPFTPTAYENFSNQFKSQILCYFKPTLVKLIKEMTDKGYSEEEMIDKFMTFSKNEAANYLIEIKL